MTAPGGPSTRVRSTASTPTGNLYAKYESRHGIERRLLDRFLRCLDAALPASTPDRVLEIGTGEGVIAERVAQRFADTTIVGVDLDDDELARHWGTRGLLGTFGDAARLPFSDGSFDLVLAIEVLEHLDEPGLALAEIRRVARGSVILSVPREPLWRIGNILRRRYVRDWGNTPGHVQHWGSRGFRRWVSQQLRVVAEWRPFPWTMILATQRPSRPSS